MGNTTSNVVLEWVHQVLGNTGQTYNIKYAYIYEDDPQSTILVVAALVICSTKNRLKGYSPGQLLFSCDIILPIKIMWIGN